MNQILMMQNKKESKKKEKRKTSSGPVKIAAIVRFFAIIIMFFGLVLSGSGTYAMIQEKKEAENNPIPQVSTQREGNTVSLTVQSNIGIRTISYSWNDASSIVNEGLNRKEITLPIMIPTGSNKLNISVVDSTGKLTKYVKNFELSSSQDVTDPVIKFEVINSGIKITATDDTALDYITYQYGDGEEVTINADESNQYVIETILPVSQGQATLTVEAFDKAGNVSTKEQEVKGANKAKISVEPDPTDPSYIIIKVEDDEGLRMVTYYINEQDYSTDPNSSLGTKTFEWRQKVEPGESKVTVHAYNINEQTTEFVGIYNY